MSAVAAPRRMWDRTERTAGITPSVLLVDPKYPNNVGMVLRLASAYGAPQVWFTGDRVRDALDGTGARLPREERMRGYRDVDLINCDRPFDRFDSSVVPVAVEVMENAESLFTFEHPPNALYVFGPEDGSIPQVLRRHCQRFVVIPSAHCLNLATAVATVLYDRRMKRYLSGAEPATVHPGETEERGWTIDPDTGMQGWVP